MIMHYTTITCLVTLYTIILTTKYLSSLFLEITLKGTQSTHNKVSLGSPKMLDMKQRYRVPMIKGKQGENLEIHIIRTIVLFEELKIGIIKASSVEVIIDIKVEVDFIHIKPISGPEAVEDHFESLTEVQLLEEAEAHQKQLIRIKLVDIFNAIS